MGMACPCLEEHLPGTRHWCGVETPCPLCEKHIRRVAELEAALQKIAGGMMSYGSDLRAIAREALKADTGKE